MTVGVCGLPKFFDFMLFRRIDEKGTGKVSKEALSKFFATELQPLDVSRRVFKVLAKRGSQFLERDDFRPLLKTLLTRHPGLDFLKATPEFQDKYGSHVLTQQPIL